jgi:hypothetical protein
MSRNSKIIVKCFEEFRPFRETAVKCSQEQRVDVCSRKALSSTTSFDFEDQNGSLEAALVFKYWPECVVVKLLNLGQNVWSLNQVVGRHRKDRTWTRID